MISEGWRDSLRIVLGNNSHSRELLLERMCMISSYTMESSVGLRRCLFGSGGDDGGGSGSVGESRTGYSSSGSDSLSTVSSSG